MTSAKTLVDFGQWPTIVVRGFLADEGVVMGMKSGEANSQRPRAARRRLREKTDRLENEIMADIVLLYQKPVEEWDWAELSHGRTRGDDGKFGGPKPRWITPAITAEAQRRMRTFTEQELMTHASDAIRTLSSLMLDNDVDDFGKPCVPASVRADIGKYFLNHVIGMPKIRAEIDTTDPLRDLMADVIVIRDGSPSHIVVEGAVVEDDE